MVNNEKILKQRNSLRSEINIRFWVVLADFAGFVCLVLACGLTFRTVVMIYLGYRILRLVLRLFGFLTIIFVYAVLVMILILVISLLVL